MCVRGDVLLGSTALCILALTEPAIPAPDGEIAAVENKDGQSKSEEPGPQAKSLGKNVSGVFVNAPVPDSGYSPSFVMRGFPGGLTLFDGAARGFTAQEVNLSTIDHVEFYKGPSAMLFGKALGGYGGAANYMRKTPTAGHFVHATATIGAFDMYRTTFDINTPMNDAQTLLFRATGFAQSVGGFVDFVRSRAFQIAPATRLVLDNGDKATLRAEYNAARSVYRDGFPASPIFLHVPREFYAGAPANEHERPNSADFTFTYEHALDADWSLATVVDYSLGRSRYGWFLGWGYDGLHSVTLGRPVQTRYAQRNFDAQLRLNGRFVTGDIGHTVFIGVEHWDYFYGHDETFARDPLPKVDIGAPLYPLGVDYSGAQWANGVARAWSRSVYAQDLIDLSAQWRILLGGRYDLLAQREIIFDPFGALSGTSSASLGKGTKGYFSPRAGLLYRPHETTQLFAAFGRSLIPNISARVRGGDAPPPQEDTQYEIGFAQSFPEYRARLEIGLFDVTRDHVATVDPADPGGFYALVTGRQHSHGVEFNLSGEIVSGLNASAAATFLHAVVAKDANVPSAAGSDLLGAPRRVFSVSLDYKPDWSAMRGLELGASYYYASAAEATLPNVYGFTLAPQQMLGLSFGYRFDDRWKLDVSASNLADRPNFTSGGALFRGEPRSISATLSSRY